MYYYLRFSDKLHPYPLTPRKKHLKHMKRENVKFIVIHCSATRSNSTYTAFQLDSDHRARGYRMAGYHFYIRRSGEIVEFRRLNEEGAHVRGFNACSVGICYEGGLRPDGTPSDTRTREQKVALKGLLGYLKDIFPWAMVVGHRDLFPDRNGDGIIDHRDWLKECPCFDAREEYHRFNNTTTAFLHL